MTEKIEARPVATARASGMPSRAAGLTWNIAQTGSHRERDDDYLRVVARPGDRWRVVVCNDRLQWIVQRRDAEKAHRAHWRGVLFRPSRDAHMAASVRLAGACDPGTLAILAALPAHFARGCGHV